VFAIVLLVVSLTLALTITRVGTVALVLTGMSHDAAHFQARSAFYGVGFTTKESETVVNHPVRRRIVTLLMLLGNVGIATVVAA
jgi:Trk-type K+ transport system membrane component